MIRLFLTFIFAFNILHAENLVRDFALYKLNDGDKRAPTLLLMGGIHGDEPGAYYATDLFMRHYKITKGSVWVVPVVNPHSMFANVRGLYGDMNRKFAALAQNDPDYQSIQKIKKLLANPQIDISMHLHDGSGYWRPTYVNNLLNPLRWGNCSVIDQIELKGAKYGNLESFVIQMVADINEYILHPLHRYFVHNTHTKSKNDTEQLKALTFFSLSLGKPALTNEASKELDIQTRVYYHLLAIESLLGQLGIEFERDFELKPASIKKLISTAHLQAHIEGLITLPLGSLRSPITYFPLPQGVEPKHMKIQSSSHILGLVKNKQGNIELKYGSRTLSTLLPQWSAFDNSLNSVNMKIDDTMQAVRVGSMIYAKESIEFEPINEYRINIIGYVKPNDTSPLPNESGIKVYKKDLMARYSLDTQALIYRAEIYRKDVFSGMITISFDKPPLENSAPYKLIAYKPAPNSPLALAHAHTKITPSVSMPPKAIASKESMPKNKHNESPNKPIIKQNEPRKTLTHFVKPSVGVNVRLKPSTQDSIIAKLPQGAKVEVLEQVGKWSKIAKDSKNGIYQEGYISSYMLSDTLQSASQENTKIIESPPKHTSQKPQDSSIKTPPINAQVKVNIAFVRLEPSLTALIVAKAPLGRKMHILSFEGQNGEWAKIHYIFEGKQGVREINGYIAKHLLNPL
ncbi:SH3 domain-containing protein [Helicobacter sp. MIT 21-1697]|uniref:M99 family carboxypeptidase catalytic domain-containing protein n=1 Tax=Helicobacter sp. MIT 21-1697 TaxID=2993733 RepID=UPI00224A5ECB|nr:M99 family carboxypeptidase catalytic domain-containing protein [Helicobacter sp. MIT 21-1697]MCX2716324.1 SH3 domain-containing protein [Helicobacter sp. MIT 21-1697]